MEDDPARARVSQQSHTLQGGGALALELRLDLALRTGPHGTVHRHSREGRCLLLLELAAQRAREPLCHFRVFDLRRASNWNVPAEVQCK